MRDLRWKRDPRTGDEYVNWRGDEILVVSRDFDEWVVWTQANSIEEAAQGTGGGKEGKRQALSAAFRVGRVTAEEALALWPTEDRPDFSQLHLDLIREFEDLMTREVAEESRLSLADVAGNYATFNTFNTEYLNQLAPGTRCRQNMGGSDLIVLAVPAGPSPRLQTLVKVYDTSTRQTRNLIGTSVAYLTKGNA